MASHLSGAPPLTVQKFHWESINPPTKPSKRTFQKAAKSLTEAMEMQADYWRKQSTLAAQAEKVRILSGQVAGS